VEEQSGSGPTGVEPVFYGEFQHTIDSKGRLIIPSRFRDVIVVRKLGQLMICRGLDRCLFLFGEQEWRTFEDRLSSLPLERSVARRFTRSLFSGAAQCDLDKQGRIMIPPPLRDHAKLDGEVVVVGVFNRVEIWNKSLWTEYQTESSEKFEDIAEQLWDFQAGKSGIQGI